MLNLKRKKREKNNDAKRPLRELGLFLADILYNAVIIIVLVILIRSFLISPFRVVGSSMADTLHNNEFILIDKLSYHLGEPKRGDPIVFLPPITDKYSHKFENIVQTDSNGLGIFDISGLKTNKDVFYCQNPLVKMLWICKEKVNDGDIIFYKPAKRDGSGKYEDNTQWDDARKKFVTPQEYDEGKISINGEPGSEYFVRVYNSTGPEYFVKRIIGIPGDIVRIENGRIYLQKPGDEAFTELDENYLNSSNKYNTFFKKMPGVSEFKVPEGNFFVLGDNRMHSNDSRHWFSPIDGSYSPYVNAEAISGKVLIVLWPIDNLRIIPD